MDNQVQVSIKCLAYNHEKYIRQCLDGFVMQKGVTFEIIIHDDASTDGTADIIREYENKYPALFKPIYQTENQYSKHVNITKEYMIPLITGKYVALCEGDDYWTDPYKLKKQYDALESNPDCYMCLHKVNHINECGRDILYVTPAIDIATSVLPIGYICNNYDNAKYIHTSCFFFRSDLFIGFYKKSPCFSRVAPGGDLPLILYFTSIGKAYYTNKAMSNHRYLSEGSYTFLNKYGADKEERVRKQCWKMREMLVEYCIFTNGKYDDCFEDEINKYNLIEYWYCIEHHNFKTLFQRFSIKELKEFGLGGKALLKMKLQSLFPKLF